MIKNTLSKKAQDIIDSYEHLDIAGKTINCPYFNNRTTNLRGALRVLVGKGTPQEIKDEARIISLRDRLELNDLDEQTIKKLLIDHNIGIDCSAFVYYILDAQLKATQNKSLKNILSFKSKNLLRQLITKFRPVENTNVVVLNENSTEIKLDEVAPGNLIIALGGGIKHDYNHTLIITETTHDDSGKLHSLGYSHSYFWKSEGKYAKGIRKGIIEIINPEKSILDQKWIEDGKTGEANETWVYLKGAEKINLTKLKI